MVIALSERDGAATCWAPDGEVIAAP